MLRWLGFATARVRASVGLVATLIALVAATTAVIAGTVAYTAAAASEAARDPVTGDEELGVTVRTRLGADPTAQDDLAQQIIRDTFSPAPVTIERTLDDSEATAYVVWRILPDV